MRQSRNTFENRPGKAGGHQRWLDAGCPQVPQRLYHKSFAYVPPHKTMNMGGESPAQGLVLAPMRDSRPSFFQRMTRIFRRTA